MNERKCLQCSTWNHGGLEHCSNCNALINPVSVAIKVKAEADEQREAEAIRNASKLELWVERFKKSPKPINQVLYKVFSVLFTIHMAIMSFFIWLIALISG